MTSAALLMPSPKPATPAQTPARDTAKESRENSKASGAKADKLLTENKDDIANTDPTLFEELMASLLNMPSLAQTPPTTLEKSVAVASVTGTEAVSDVSSSGTADLTNALPIITAPVIAPVTNDMPAAPVQTAPVQTSVTADSKPAVLAPQFGSGFNVNPSLLILPQDNSGTMLTKANSFSDELLSALTPGIQAPAQPAPETTAPVPVTTVSAPTTPALTVSSDTSADPRVVACGFDPVGMKNFTDKLAAAQSQTTNATTQASADDTGIVTITFNPETAAPQPTQSAASASLVAASLDNASSPVDINAGLQTSETATQTDFDPVEFRIAQRFQRPASPSSSPVTQMAASTQSSPQSVQAPGAAISANTSHAVSTDVKGKVDGGSGMASSIAAAASQADASLLSADDGMANTTSAALPFTLSGNLTAPIAQNISAVESHPAIQTVAAVIAKGAKTEGAQTISLRLDPPELGKLQVQMKYKKGDPLRVHVVLEKADTAAMFQRDSHALESALNDAGLQTDGSSLSFELSDGGTFNQAMNQDSSGSQQQASAFTDTNASDLPALETSMGIFTDNRTGLTHYNLRV